MPSHEPLESVLARWRTEVRRALPWRSDAEVDEVADHLAQRWMRLRADRVSEEDADRQLRLDLSAWQTAPTHARGDRRPPLFTGWLGDGAHAWRVMRNRPGWALAFVILTALGAAAALATATIAYGLLMRPLPYPASDRLAVIWQVHEGSVGQVSLLDFRDLSGDAVFEGASAISGGQGSLRVGDGIERVNLIALEPAGFALLSARPQRGRLLGPADTGTDTVLVSDRLWRTHLGAAEDVVGRSVWLSGRTYTVAGVLMPGFDFELPVGGRFCREAHDLWTLVDPSDPLGTRRDVHAHEGLVRLAPGVSLEQAQTAVDGIGRRLEAEHASTNRGRTFQVRWLHDEVVARARQPLLLAALAAAVTIGIALVNLLTLVGVRIADRQTEFAVRHALGAGALRLRRQLVTEHLLLVALGTALGVLLARALVHALAASEAAHLPRRDAIQFDAPIWLAASALALLLVAALSALPMRTVSIEHALAAGHRALGGQRRLRRILIATQLALALALATGSALLGLSLARLLAVDPGFAPQSVTTVRLSAYAARYPERADVEAFIRDVLSGIEAVPGIAHAAAGSSLPLSGQATTTAVMAEGQVVDPAERLSAGWEFITPGYVDAIGLRIRQGRAFTSFDRQRGSHVALVNEALARALFPGQDPVGRRIAVGGGDREGDWHEIVGVVGDARHHALAEAPLPRVYDLFGQHWGRTLFVVARAEDGGPAPAVTSLRRAVAVIDAEAPVFSGDRLLDLVERSAAANRLSALLAAGLAAVGMLLALLGVYAVTAASVAERRREMGLRTALGAAPHDVLRLVLREAGSTVGAGALAGVGVAFWGARLLESRVFGLEALDALVVVPVLAGALLLVGVASAIPAARQAAGADPLASIRQE